MGVTLRSGCAIFVSNMNAHGTADLRTMHHVNLVEGNNVKLGINIWVTNKSPLYIRPSLRDGYFLNFEKQSR